VVQWLNAVPFLNAIGQLIQHILGDGKDSFVNEKVTGRRRLSYENPSKYWGTKREYWKPEAKLARLS
jgi:hypothetical protein